MTVKCKDSKTFKPSVRYKSIQTVLQSSKPHDTLPDGNTHLTFNSNDKTIKKEENVSSNITTSKFVSAISGIWGIVGQQDDNHTKSSLQYGELNGSNNCRCETSLNDSTSISCSPSSAKSNFEDLKTFKKMICLASCSRNKNDLNISSNSHSDLSSSTLERSVVTISSAENKGSSLAQYANSSKTTVGTIDYSSAENIDSSLAQNVNSSEKTGCTNDSSCQSRSFTSSIGSNIKLTVSADWDPGQCKESTISSCVAAESLSGATSQYPIIHKNCAGIIHDFVANKNCIIKEKLSVQDKAQLAFAKNKHAVAGALAGTLVSLFLHPVDTVKTVIQANGMGQKSISEILQTIISRRGSLGLYRGIASNIASSAPISAIYTCTYESVKGALLPVLPKEYCSLAHSIAGGCSSVATSFVYTPSERIKQQMQVGTRYQNSWSVLIKCLQIGGISSLYTGWGAVLCRNIPHSVIKFYTYESLKQSFLKLSKPNTSSLSTYQTLACGGIAGSTAALFTTPFDVVKTRLQTQVPGSSANYNGVFHALHEIASKEGLQGLYRGLTPRLAMYVSQGSIFFASYEFLKAVCSLDNCPEPSRLIKNEQNVDAEYE